MIGADELTPAPLERARALRRIAWNYSEAGQKAIKAMFARFNRDFFGGRIRPYGVEFVERRWIARALHGWDGGMDQYRNLPAEAAAITIYRDSLILMDGELLWHPRTVEGVLIHEMIHASGRRGHGEQFTAEAQHLEAKGAPVREDDTVSRRFTRRLMRQEREEQAKRKGGGR